MLIGIDDNRNFVYEGNSYHGRALWPAPVISPAKIVFESEGPLRPEQSSDSIGTVCRFREDFYDPIARIRRGRFYFAEGTQPARWFVQPHPAMPLENGKCDEVGIEKYLDTFAGHSVWYKVLRGKTEQALVLLGLEDRFTVWTIINVEAISTGEDLVTLKARSGLGVLPVVDETKVPEAFRTGVRESLDGFADEVHRSAPASVIDRARDAASHILLAYFEASGKDAKDLRELAKRLESKEPKEKEKIVAASAAKIIARLHARAKPSERERREMRPIREQDAELATQCVGTILCELGWADWP